MSGILFLLVVGLVAWILVRRSTDNKAEISMKIYQVNQQWMDYIAAQYKKATNEDEKNMLNAMLLDLQQQGMPMPLISYGTASPPQAIQATYPLEQTQQQDNQHKNTQIATENIVRDYNLPKQEELVKKPLDNISILLYFSAFLVVVAAGLFVAFGDISGSVKTFTIAIVTAFLYCLGFWLWYSKPALKQAGLTFIGMGIIIAPLVGVAAYTYTFKQSGNIVWLITSLACLGLYAHAMWALKHPLLEYVLIGTFVSLFESVVSVIDLPIYYYGWSLAVIGLIIQTIQVISKKAYDVAAPTVVSSNILLPLSVVVSFWMIPEHGWTQLGISLLFGATYYGLMIWQLSQDSRKNAAVAAHVMLLSGIAVLTYGVNQSLPQVTLSLLILSIPQILLIFSKSGEIIKSFATILLSSLVVATFIAWQDPKMLLSAALLLAVMSSICWLRQLRAGCYQLAVGALIVSVLDISFRIIGGDNMALIASILSLGLLGSQIITLYFVQNSEKDSTIWRAGYQALALTTLAVAILASIFTTHTQTILLVVSSVILLIPLIIMENISVWSLMSSILLAVLFVRVMNSEGHWLITIVLGLLWNIGLTYFYRKESSRGFSTIMMLFLPIAVGRLVLTDVSYDYYTVAYFALIPLFLLSRWLVIRRLGTVEYGTSYTAGYIFAATASIVVSAYAWDWLPAIVCVGVALLFWLSSKYVEKQPVLMVTIPLLLQIGLWMVYLPQNMVAYLCISFGISLLGYVYGAIASMEQNESSIYIQKTSLLLLFIPLALYLSGTVWWPMPWALFIAGIVLLHYLFKRGQDNRELAGGMILLGIWLLMYFYGVRNVQAYSHALAGLLASYAYWRHLRGEKAIYDKYIVWTLAVVTIPLIIQALFGRAGDLYGWWLLIEQIAIMLLGMTLGNRLMIRWGLYIALGSVLYQLRNLGWAALAVLAVFLMSIAIYRLQKHSNDSTKNKTSE